MTNDMTPVKFESAVKATKELQQSNGIFVLVAPSVFGFAEIKVRAKEQELDTTLRKFSLRRDEFDTLVEEIAHLIEVCLDGNVERYIKRTVRRWRRSGEYSESEIAAKEQELSRKLDFVADQLVDQPMEQTYRLKQLTKGRYLLDIGWEIKVKRFDSEQAIATPWPSATLQILHAGRVATFLWHDVQSFEFDLTAGEVDYLLWVMGMIKERMTTLQDAEPSDCKHHK